MAQNENSKSHSELSGLDDDTIIRLQAMQLMTLRAEAPTLRDQFAMAALTGMTLRGPGSIPLTIDARDCYEWADAMMEARKSNPSVDDVRADADFNPADPAYWQRRLKYELAAQSLRDGEVLKRAVLDERERCAKITEQTKWVCDGPPVRFEALEFAQQAIAQKIRSGE